MKLKNDHSHPKGVHVLQMIDEKYYFYGYN
jgi:hypothetical protein